MSLDGWTVDPEDWDAEPVISWEEHLSHMQPTACQWSAT